MSALKPLSGKSILVVEDQPLVALNVTETLQNAGAATITTRCTIDACTHLDENDIAAAVVDIDLGLSGDCEALCHALQRNGIPLIFYTGHPNAPLMRLWPSVPILGKPASDRELLDMVERIVVPPTPNPASAQSAQSNCHKHGERVEQCCEPAPAAAITTPFREQPRLRVRDKQL